MTFLIVARKQLEEKLGGHLADLVRRSGIGIKERFARARIIPDGDAEVPELDSELKQRGSYSSV